MPQGGQRPSILEDSDAETTGLVISDEDDEEMFSRLDDIIGSTPSRDPRLGKPPTPKKTAEEDVSDISVNDNGAIKELEKAGFNFNQDNDEEWAKVCELFSCKTTDKEARVAGIKVSIRGHQMVAIYRALAQVTTDVSSFMIGDDVGLGKTGTTLMTLAIFHMFHRTRDEVIKEWETNTRGEKKHLKQDEAGRCPSQEGRVHCWCNAESLARKVTKILPDFPNLVVIKPDLIDNWVREFDKFIAAKDHGSPTRDMELAVAYSTYDKVRNLTLNGREHRIKPTLRPNSKMAPPYNGSSTIVYSSSKAMNQLRQLNTIDIEDDDERPPKIVPFLAFAFIVFEEFHDYHGIPGKPTIPFKFLRDLAELDETRPTMAIGLSGSIKSDMRYWYPMIEHAFYNAELKGRALSFTNMAKLEDYTQLLNYWNYLVQHLQPDVSELEGKRGEEIKQRSSHLIPFLKDIIPKMIIARNQGDRFRGGEPLYVKQEVEWIDMPMTNGSTKQVFTDLSHKVKSWMEVRFIKEVEDAKKTGRVPLERKAWMNQQARNLPVQVGTTPDFSLCTRASCFPMIARIIHEEEDEELSYNDTLFGDTNDLKRLATSISKALLGVVNPSKAVRGESISNLLRTSVWYKHREALYNESPKMMRIVKEIDDLLKIRKLPLDHPDVAKTGLLPPSDGTNVRHTVIFADTNLTAFLIFMILYTLYHNKNKNISLLYCHSGVLPGERDAFVDYIQQDCTADSPNKVLIATTDTLGVGHNLYRASQAIIVDVPVSSDKQLQAFGRVDRPGNRQRPRVIQLFDSTNLSELVRVSRNHNREVLSKIGHGETLDWDNYLSRLPPAKKTPERGTKGRPIDLE
ncbi:hypothetical protein F5Y18DRAFT_442452 [Xylariaceae sp. FL1019]|nr:hypothetical protein F5Y18DRAFT_442452 [Xylariaceae sp. FL1019]